MTTSATNHLIWLFFFGIVLVLGSAVLKVWGSMWKVNLHAVLDPEQPMLVEELPVTAWRRGLLVVRRLPR